MLGMSLSTGRGLSGPLYRVDQVPPPYQEHFIIRGYRSPRRSFTQCLLSLLDPTNETLNFWTHFLPFLYFLWLIIQFSSTMDFLRDSYSWPLLCYMLSCCAFTIASAIAHLFNIMSENARHVCFFLDYAALSLFICGSAAAFRAYSFPASFVSLDDNSSATCWFADTFVMVTIFQSISCTCIACYSRFMKQSPFTKLLRLGSFALPYIYQMIPIVIRLSTPQPPPSMSSSVGLEKSSSLLLSADYYLKRQFFWAFLSAFLYASHLPERIVPGLFDIVGHSHQLFHVVTTLAVLDQLQSLVLDIRERRDLMMLSSRWIFHSPFSSLGAVGFAVLMNCVVILMFSYKLYNSNNNKNKMTNTNNASSSSKQKLK